MSAISVGRILCADAHPRVSVATDDQAAYLARPTATNSQPVWSMVRYCTHARSNDLTARSDHVQDKFRYMLAMGMEVLVAGGQTKSSQASRLQASPSSASTLDYVGTISKG